jgi:hypothetical protein
LLIADDEADQALDGTLTWATEAASETDAYQTQIAPSYARERTAHGQVSQGANQSYIYRIPDSGTNGFETGTDFEGHYHGADLPAETLSYNGTSQAGGRRAQFAKHAKRTIHLLNLPEGITSAATALLLCHSWRRMLRLRISNMSNAMTCISRPNE